MANSRDQSGKCGKDLERIFEIYTRFLVPFSPFWAILLLPPNREEKRKGGGLIYEAKFCILLSRSLSPVLLSTTFYFPTGILIYFSLMCVGNAAFFVVRLTVG